MKHHPDRLSPVERQEQNSGELISKIKSAYNVLKNPDSRRRYDQSIESSTYSAPASDQPTKTASDIFSDISSINDFYRKFQLTPRAHRNKFASYFDAIAKQGLNLDHRQIRSIVNLILNFFNDYEFVRRAAVIALENYIEHLTIYEIELLRLSSSDYLSNRNSKEKEIQRLTKKILNKWFEKQFQNSKKVDKLISDFVDIEITNLSINVTEITRQKILDVLENNIQMLNESHINHLKLFDKNYMHHDRKLKERVQRLIEQWTNIDSSTRKTSNSPCPKRFNKL